MSKSNEKSDPANQKSPSNQKQSLNTSAKSLMASPATFARPNMPLPTNLKVVTNAHIAFRFVAKNNFAAFKPELIEMLADWRDYFTLTAGGKEIFDKKIFQDWEEILSLVLQNCNWNMMRDCHLLDVNNECQGIALCDWMKIYPRNSTSDAKVADSYHIHELLTAPWNILPRCITKYKNAASIDYQNKSTYKGVGTALLVNIVMKAQALKASSITVCAGSYESNVYQFYQECGFDSTHESAGNFRLTEDKYAAFLQKFQKQSAQPQATSNNPLGKK